MYDMETLKQFKNYHKINLTDFDIIAPKIFYENFKEYIIAELSMKGELMDTHVCKYSNIKDIRKEFNILRDNFQKEVCDSEIYDDPSYIYLFVASVLGSGYKKTNKFRCIGFVEVYESTIQIIWLHPFFRNQKIMQSFFLYYSLNVDVLNVQPPITKGLQFALNKFEENLKKSPKLYSSYKYKQTIFFKEFLKKFVPTLTEQIDILSEEEVKEIKNLITIFQATNSYEEIKVDPIKSYEIVLKMFLYKKYNPSDVEMFAKEFINAHPDKVSEDYLIKCIDHHRSTPSIRYKK